VGSRAGLDAAVKRNIPSPRLDSNTRSSSPQFSGTPLSYPGSCLWDILNAFNLSPTKLFFS